MAVANAMSVTVIIAVSLSAAIGVSSAEFSIGSSARAAYKKCTKDKTRCAGAPGYPYVHYAPCCEKTSMCIEDEALGWGKWCVKPKKERKGKCYLNKSRCMGAPGKPYIPYYKCCGGGECVADEKLGWGKFCKSGKYGDDYKVSEYGKGYKVVYYDDDKKGKKEKRMEAEHEKKSYKNYVDEYEKEYYAKDYEKEYKDYDKYKSKDEYKKSYGSDYGYGYGYGYGKGKKAKGVVVPGKGHGKDFIKKILGPNGGNPFCRVNGEPLASSSVQIVTIPVDHGSSKANLIIRSSTACGATAATFPLRIVTAIVNNVCAQFRTLVPTGNCGFTLILDGTTIRMANVEGVTTDVSVRQAGASAVIIEFTFSYPCAFAATAARFISQNFDQVIPNNAVCSTTTPASTATTVSSTTTAASAATSTIANVVPGGPPLVCRSSSGGSSSSNVQVSDNKQPAAGNVARFVKVTIPAASLCPGTTPTTLSKENADRIQNSICDPIRAQLSPAKVDCRIIGLVALVSTSRTAVVRQATPGGVVVRQADAGLDLEILIEVLESLVAALEQAIAQLTADANVSDGSTPPGVTPSS